MLPCPGSAGFKWVERSEAHAEEQSAPFNGRAALPEPTAALPGTPEKVAILEQRARLKQALWHPLDAPMDAESARLGIAS